MPAGRIVEAALTILAVIWFLRFWIRTRFWFPRYIHWMAVVALAVGLWLVTVIPADAPMYRGGWIVGKQAAAVLLFPAIVYIVFLVHGGQRAAFQAQRRTRARQCPHCGRASVSAGEPCRACGQALPI